MVQALHIVVFLSVTVVLFWCGIYLGWRIGKAQVLAREEYAEALRKIIKRQDIECEQLLDRILLMAGQPQAVTIAVDRQEPSEPQPTPNPYPPDWQPGAADFLIQGAGE